MIHICVFLDLWQVDALMICYTQIHTQDTHSQDTYQCEAPRYQSINQSILCIHYSMTIYSISLHTYALQSLTLSDWYIHIMTWAKYLLWLYSTILYPELFVIPGPLARSSVPGCDCIGPQEEWHFCDIHLYTYRWDLSLLTLLINLDYWPMILFRTPCLHASTTAGILPCGTRRVSTSPPSAPEQSSKQGSNYHKIT